MSNIKLISNLEKKLQITITTTVFFLVVVKTFSDKFSQPDNTLGSDLYLTLSGIVAIYCLCMGIFWAIDKKKITTKQLKIMNFLLNINIILTGLMIIFLTLTEKLSSFPKILITIINYSASITGFIIIVIPVTIFACLIISYPINMYKSIKK